MGSVARAERLEDAGKLLRDHLKREGLRRTSQRDVVLAEFLEADTHISAEELYDRIRDRHPSIGYATVYRCLNLFVQAGIANERRFNEGRVRFEPAVRVDHHDHLICTKCGTILEFEDERIEKLQEEIARARGFDVAFHRMELYGLCADCRADD